MIAILAGDMPEKKVYESSGNKMLLMYTAKRGISHRGFIANYTSLQPAICGGEMDSSKNGSLFMYIKQNEAYVCEWIYINHSPSTHLTITFIYTGTINNNFQEYPQSCLYANSFISFGDGKKYIGIFCSETKPNQPFIISKPHEFSKVTLVKPKIKSENKNISFNLSWKIDQCGSIMKNIAEANVRSPGNAKYPSNIDCVWSVSVPEGSVMKIHFEKFDLETDCSHDYLKIFNGNSPRSPLISHHCGNIVPADIITQSNTAWFLFHSDESIEKSGFELKITETDSGCGGIIHGKHGLIQSPSYPSNYKNNIECDWEVRVDSGFHIGLIFGGRFFIEDSPGCQHDYIEISDYVSGQWKVLSRICGREIPKQSFNSSSNMMKIFFKTNSEITGDGFKAMWMVNCGGVINVAGPGHIYSPGWPNGYLNFLDCNYTLRAPKRLITAEFETFSLEESTTQGCTFDKVQIWIKKHNNDYFESNGIYCGHNKPSVQISLDEMIIYFSTDSYLVNKGFSIAYDIESCGGDVTEEGIISSPKLQDMLTEARCTWNITAPSNRIIILKLSNLRLSSFPNCSAENIKLWDISKSSDNGILLARLCGAANSLPVFRSSGNKMKLDFKSPFYSKRKGFTAIVSFAYGEKVGCGGTFFLPGNKTDIEKSITNPDINNDGMYENNMDCHWVVSTSAESTLIVNFIKMDLKTCRQNASKGACCDALEVYDGPSERNELIGRYCGKLIPRTFSSSGNYLAFRFVSDGIDQAGGFKITVLPHVSTCGASVLKVQDAPQFLKSPNYPASYPINTHCRWMIVGEKWKVINIHFIDLEVEETTDCVGDRVEIFDESTIPWKYSAGNNDTHRLIFAGKYMYLMSDPQPSEKNMFCGKGLPLDYYSVSNRVMVRFISDSLRTSKGFKFQYSYATCSRNYTAPYGRILLNSIKDNCTITITAMKNRTISMYFSSMSIHKDYEKETCLNKLEVFEGTNKLTEVCGWSAPPPIFSETNTVTLRLTVIRTTFAFDMTYTTTDEGRGCGGTFYNEVGAFTSPMYPGNYRNYSYCCWEVTVPLPGVPSFHFNEFDLGMRSTCDSDYVEIFDVSGSGEKIHRTSYCGGDNPARFRGRSQTAAVCYKSSIHNSGLGWSARWSTIANLEGEEVPGTALL